MTARELSDYEIELAKQYMEASKAIRWFNEQRVKARDQLTASLGEDEGLIDGVKALSVSRVRPITFNTERFGHDHPALLAQYREPAQTPRVTLLTHKGLDAVMSDD